MKQIFFFKTDSSILLIDFLRQKLELSAEASNFLIQIGAIYVSQNPTPLTSQIPSFKRETQNRLLPPETIVRCHKNPRRFPHHFNWAKRIIFENNDFLIVDKPHGLPCQPSLDNRLENVLEKVSDLSKQNLFITHRLDVGTGGLLVLSKSRYFQSYFNKQLELNSVDKNYVTLTVGPLLQENLYTHWMKPDKRAPKILSETSVERWKECQIEIIQAKSINKIEAINPSNALNFYKLKLLTGRTHQIRAQLSSLKNFICGDFLYGSSSSFNFKSLNSIDNFILSESHEFFALFCTKIAFEYLGTNYEFEISSPINI